MTIKQNLRPEIINNPLAVVIEAALEKTFHDLHSHLKSQTAINPDFSGSMLTIVLIINDILYSANVGNIKGISLSGTDIKQITKDHTFAHLEERLRALTKGAFIRRDKNT